MKRRLPPLNALRAFEAAAERLNFTRAAEDLAVTPTAISHQIRQLEDWFGRALFVRGKRQMSLTDSGSQLYPVISNALDNLTETCQRIVSSPQRSTLTVSVTPTFGTRWLAARLGKFFSTYPDIDLRIHHSVHSVDFEREDVDIAIRWGFGPWPNTVAQWLIDADNVPMCSPKLQQGPKPLKQPEDLQHHVLLHDENHQEWTEWLIAAGLDQIDGSRGPVLGDANAMVRAAIEGVGVFLGTETMMATELKSGELILPFELSDNKHPSYFLVYPPASEHFPMIQAFRNFVLEESKVVSADG